ncbi:MAG: bacillithiol biosynthesis deacetylase BshB1 [candidate division Zixibacteria bacterium]|nr:bacillithiol biosynthesis deacetylase BshB1 [candidate division Zixibacteria bacterium]
MTQTTPTVDALALAAHRDDIEITCGGLLLKLADLGYKTGIVDFTAGEMGTRGTAEDRAAEAAAAAKVLGLTHRENLGMPDAKLENSLPNRMAVADVIRRLRPRLVILPHREQRHPDHRVAGEIAYDACFMAGLKKLDLPGEPHRPHKILYSAFSRQPPFSIVVEITKQLDRKLAAVRAYTSQFGTKEGASSIYQPGVDIFELITIDARRMGQMIRKPYAEAYVIRESIEIEDPMTMTVPSI